MTRRKRTNTIQHGSSERSIKKGRVFSYLTYQGRSPYPHLAVAEEGIEQFAERLPHPPPEIGRSLGIPRTNNKIPVESFGSGFLFVFSLKSSSSDSCDGIEEVEKEEPFF